MVLPLPFNCWNDFNELEIVEVATPKAKAAPLPADISPTTPNFTPSQGYLGPAPSGIHATWPRILPGGRGEGVRVVDIERAWQLDHEDFPAVVSSSVHGIEDYKFHGTAVIGQIAAVENSYGMTGIAPAAEIAVYSDTTVTGSFELADAIARATVASRPGDVILIEEQVYCGTDFGPVEYDDSLLACIDAAVANGRVVVVPAGNGGLNLDDTARFGDRFQRNVVNSGAIYVGAADAGTLRAAAFSNFGSRIDFQGWGDSVATLGSGELFHPNRDDRQAYTGSFSGTSSAAPMVAGVSPESG